ncbi:MAG: glycerophosphoryl diester phosphodiesterase [Alphaproteobacteria bacterium]|nr:glycerophosphoryl diester phosphodiesterase [Alphaproteobacteria bacterium]
MGHRGVAAYAPENTLEGIHAAADMGVEWIELDVKLTKDSVPILFHDETLERTTNGHGPVAQATLSDIRALECGDWFSEGFGGIAIPTLEEAMDVLMERGLGVNIELKPCPGREIETAEAALDILSRSWDAHDQLLISSFSHVALETAMDMAPEWARGLILPTEWPKNWQDIIHHLKLTTININGNTVTQIQMRELLKLNKRILAYTINDPERAALLQSWGVDGFFSDEPDIIREGLGLVH